MLKRFIPSIKYFFTGKLNRALVEGWSPEDGDKLTEEEIDTMSANLRRKLDEMK